MYAIAFDLDTTLLKDAYKNDSWQNAYGEIRKTLMGLGFEWQQGSVCLGKPEISAVDCVLAIQTLSAQLPWFATAVRDVRMLRIEEMNDLRPAVDRAAAAKGAN